MLATQAVRYVPREMIDSLFSEAHLTCCLQSQKYLNVADKLVP